jgi:hypothetical protein
MKNEKTRNSILKFSFAAIATAGVAFLFAVNANAQYGRSDRRVIRAERVESRNIARIAEAQGYGDGLREGAKSIRRRKSYNPYGAGKYRKGTNGYQSRLGSKSTYKRFYQQAFVRGYNQAYDRGNRGFRPARRNW